MNNLFIVHALAVSNYGYHCFPVSAITRPCGSGSIIVTGNVAPLARECVEISRSLLLANGIDFSHIDIHIHAADTLNPKSGHSWSIAIYCLLAWCTNFLPYQKGVAATGELDLMGNVLPVPMINEKIAAFKQSECKHVLLPVKNLTELIDPLVENFSAINSVSQLTKLSWGENLCC